MVGARVCDADVGLSVGYDVSRSVYDDLSRKLRPDILLKGIASDCTACGFEWEVREVWYGQDLEVVFNLDGDIKGYDRAMYKVPMVFHSMRGAVSGGSSLFGGEGQKNRHALSSGYLEVELSQKALRHHERQLKIEMEKLGRLLPNEQCVVNYKDGITAKKHAGLIALTDNVPFVFPPDTSELIYEVLPVFVQRGCRYKCSGCSINSSVNYTMSELGVERQLRFLQENYPNTTEVSNGLLIAGEDPLMLDSSFLLKVMQRAESKFVLSRNPKPLHVNKLQDYNDAEGFAYAFASFGSLMGKTVEELVELREAGLRRLNVGLESVDSRVLQRFPKHTLDQVISGLEKVREAGIPTSVNVVAGFGEEFDEEHLVRTAEFLRKVGFDGRVFLSRYKDKGGRFGTGIQDFFRLGKAFADVYNVKNMVRPYPMVFL
jgi:hypothetical protein